MLKDTSVTAGIRTHILLLTPELASGKLDRSATTLHSATTLQDSSDSELLNHIRRGPVLLGCNVLQLLTDLEVDKEQTDSEAWRLTLQWYRLTKMPSKEGQRGNYKLLESAFAARTGRNSIVIQPRQARTLNWQIRAPEHVLKDKTVIVTGLQSGRVATSATRSEGASNLGAAGVVYMTLVRLAMVKQSMC